MGNYELENWKTSTLKTLIYLHDQNGSGKKPKAKDVRNGTMVNWLYALKQGQYVVDEDGFSLTEKGKQLLIELKHNPPIRTRKKENVRSQFRGNQTHDSTEDVQVSIRSSKIMFDVLIPPEKAKKLLKFVTDLVEK